MKFILQRLKDNGKSTTGEYIFPHIDWKPVSMEDTGRDLNHDGDLKDPGEVKVWGKTRIPCGEYEVVLWESGTLHEKYKKRFPLMHKGMLKLLDVPHFRDIYIHILNESLESHGCPGIGLKKYDDDYILQSTTAYKKLYMMLLEFFSQNERVFIQIIDEPTIKEQI